MGISNISRTLLGREPEEGEGEEDEEGKGLWGHPEVTQRIHHTTTPLTTGLVFCRRLSVKDDA